MIVRWFCVKHHRIHHVYHNQLIYIVHFIHFRCWIIIVHQPGEFHNLLIVTPSIFSIPSFQWRPDKKWFWIDHPEPNKNIEKTSNWSKCGFDMWRPWKQVPEILFHDDLGQSCQIGTESNNVKQTTSQSSMAKLCTKLNRPLWAFIVDS